MTDQSEPTSGGRGLVFLIIILLCIPVFVVPAGVLLLLMAAGEETQATCTAPNGGQALTVTVDPKSMPQIIGYNPQQMALFAVIMKVASDNGFGAKGQEIGIITVIQESTAGANEKTRKPNPAGDAGPFQQRQLPGWYGSLEQVNDPTYAATAFYNGVTATEPGGYGSVGGTGKSKYGHLPGLVDISGWESMESGAAAQAVQKSDHPTLYSQHIKDAQRIMTALSGVEVNVASGADASAMNCAAGTVSLDGLPTQAQLEAPDTAVACPDGTTDLGIHTGGVNGGKVPIRLCSVTGTVCTGTDCRKGSLDGLARGEVVVNAMIAPFFMSWIAQVREAGLNPTFNSSYRSWASQVSLQGPNAARPGWSNHQMGYAVDINGLPGGYRRNNCSGHSADGSCMSSDSDWTVYHDAGLANGAAFHDEEFWHLEWLVTRYQKRDLPFIPAA